MKIKSHSPKAIKDIYVGIAGAGFSSLPDNVAIKRFGEQIGAQMYKAEAIIGAPVKKALHHILHHKAQNSTAEVYLFGYSAGGDAVIRLARMLNGHKVSVKGMVTFDPHSPRRLYGFDNYVLSENVHQSLNFFQHNAISHVAGCPLGKNPFIGGLVATAHEADITNIDVSSKCVHVGAFYTPMAHYPDEIAEVLNLNA